MVATTLPAVVRVVDLPTGTTVTGAELFEAVQTSSGIGQSVQLSLTQMMNNTVGALPTGGGTGQILNKLSAANYTSQWSNITQFVAVGTSLSTTGSATSIVAFVANQGISSTEILNNTITSTQMANNAIGTNQLASSLGIASSLSIGTLLTVGGTATFNGGIVNNGSLGITGNVLLTGNLGVVGSSLFTGSIGIIGTVGITGTTLITGTFGQVGTSLMTGLFGVSGTSNFTGAFGVVGTALFTSGNFGVVGTTQFTSNTFAIAATTAVITGTIVFPTNFSGFLQTSGTGVISTTTAVTNVTASWGLTSGASAITTTGAISIATTNPPFGYDAAINLQLNITTAATNLLSVSVKGNNGSDPSGSNPVLIPFRSTSVTSGAPIWAAVTAALSIQSVSGASFGAAANVPFRLWVVSFYNGGTPLLALINCCNITSGTSGGQIFPLNVGIGTSSSQMVATSTLAGVFYTPNGTTVTNSPYCILGYLEYNAGLANPGIYTSAPTGVQLFGAGIKKPGDTVQETQFIVGGASVTVNSTTYTVSPLTTSFTLVGGAMNAIRVDALGQAASNVANAPLNATLRRGSSSPIGTFMQVGAGTNVNGMAVPLFAYDVPGTTTATTYAVFVAASTINSTVIFGNGAATAYMSLTIRETMV